MTIYFNTFTAKYTKLVENDSGLLQYFNLSLLPQEIWQYILDGGGNLTVWDELGSTRYPLHILSCNTSTETGWIKILAPISSSINTPYKLYINKSGSTQPLPGDSFGQYAVYDINVRVDWNFGETPDDTPGQIKDASQYEKHGTSFNLPEKIDCVLGDAIDFDASSQQKIVFPDVFCDVSNGMTWSFILEIDDLLSNFFLSDQRDTNVGIQPAFINNLGNIQFYSSATQNNDYFLTSLNISTKYWVDLVLGDNPGKIKCYVNSIFIGEKNDDKAFFTPKSMTLAARHTGVTDFFDGKLCKYNILSEPRSENKIKNLYSNQFDNTDFYNIGVLVTIIPPVLSDPLNGEIDVNTTPVLSWDEVIEKTSYRLQIAEDLAFSNIIQDQSDILNETFNPSLLDVNTLYYWRVLTNFEDDFSEWSEIWSFTTREGLEAPTDVKVIPSYEQNTINWSNPPGATSFNIYWKTTPGVTTSDNKITGVTNGYIHEDLTNEQPYYYKIEALNLTETSVLSDEVSATPSELANIESAILAHLLSDSNVTDLVSLLDGDPAIFTDVAAQESVERYIVFNVQKTGSEIMAIDELIVDVDVYDRGISSKKIRQLCNAIEDSLDYILLNSLRNMDIRIFASQRGFVEIKDIEITHYNMAFDIWATRTAWMNQLP